MYQCRLTTPHEGDINSWWARKDIEVWWHGSHGKQWIHSCYWLCIYDTWPVQSDIGSQTKTKLGVWQIHNVFKHANFLIWSKEALGQDAANCSSKPSHCWKRSYAYSCPPQGKTWLHTTGRFMEQLIRMWLTPCKHLTVFDCLVWHLSCLIT